MGRLRARHKSIRELRIKEKDARRARRGKSPLRHLPILHLLLLLAALFTPLDCARLLSNKSVQTIVVKQLRSSLYTPFYRRAPRTGLQREMSECDRETDSRRSLASPGFRELLLPSSFGRISSHQEPPQRATFLTGSERGGSTEHTQVASPKVLRTFRPSFLLRMQFRDAIIEMRLLEKRRICLCFNSVLNSKSKELFHISQLL